MTDTGNGDVLSEGTSIIVSYTLNAHCGNRK